MSGNHIPSGPYLYALVDDDGATFYIGKGRGRRMYQHKKLAMSGAPGPKCDRIREVLARGGDIKCVVLAEFDTDESACAAEVQMIASVRDAGLTNLTKGGEAGGLPNHKEIMRSRFVRLKERIRRRGVTLPEWIELAIDAEILDPSPNVARWSPATGVVFDWDSRVGGPMSQRSFTKMIQEKTSG